MKQNLTDIIVVECVSNIELLYPPRAELCNIFYWLWYN